MLEPSFILGYYAGSLVTALTFWMLEWFSDDDDEPVYDNWIVSRKRYRVVERLPEVGNDREESTDEANGNENATEGRTDDGTNSDSNDDGSDVVEPARPLVVSDDEDNTNNESTNNQDFWTKSREEIAPIVGQKSSSQSALCSPSTETNPCSGVVTSGGGAACNYSPPTWTTGPALSPIDLTTSRQMNEAVRVNRTEEVMILRSFSSLIGQKYTDAEEVARERGYHLHILYFGDRTVPALPFYDPHVIGIRLSDDRTVTGLLDVGGVDRSRALCGEY